MAYICKDCSHNNNGWCKYHKKQGLKQITKCSECTTKFVELSFENILSKSPLIDDSFLKEQSRTIGKVEVLTFLLQLLNKVKDLPAEEQLKAIKNHIQVQSSLTNHAVQEFHVEDNLNYMIDADMLSAFEHYIGGFKC